MVKYAEVLVTEMHLRSFALGAAAAGVTAAAAAYLAIRRAARRKRLLWRSSHSLPNGERCVVRAAETEDADVVIEFVHKLAEADGGLEQIKTSTQTIRQAFVGGDFDALLVELEASTGLKTVAMAVVQQSFRTYTGVPARPRSRRLHGTYDYADPTVTLIRYLDLPARPHSRRGASRQGRRDYDDQRARGAVLVSRRRYGLLGVARRQ